MKTRMLLWCVGCLCFAVLNAAGLDVVADAPQRLHQWKFDGGQVKGGKLMPVAGDVVGVIQGKPSFVSGSASFMALDGTSNSILLAPDGSKIALPKQDITLEAWVNVDQIGEWGGFISAIQDNGDYERGFLLGFRKNQFCVAVASEKARRLTYLTCKTPFETGKWYHVVGTYDGKELRIYMNGKLENTSAEQQGPILYAPKFFYELAAYHDDNEHYRVKGKVHELAVYDKALSGDDIAKANHAKLKLFPKPIELVEGPFVHLHDHQSATVSFVTDQPCPTVVEISGKGGTTRRIENKVLTTTHTIKLDQLLPQAENQIRVHVVSKDGGTGVSEPFKFDTTFFYDLPARLGSKSPFAVDASSGLFASVAKAALDKAGVDKGYCLIVGCGDGRLAYEIATRSNMQVVAIDDNEANVAQARQLLDEAGLYGVRVSVHHGNIYDLPYGPYFANLILSQSCLLTGKIPADARELHRVLRPSGGVLMLGSAANADTFSKTLRDWSASLQGAAISQIAGGEFVTYKRPKLENSGVWTHQYGEADNSSNSKDELIKGPMEVLWWGKPGPRPMPDRGARNPAPLSANGRLYVQGDRILFGIDAYNGTILWSSQQPMMRRTNIPRDSSNMVASDDYLYIAVGQHVYGINGQTGHRDIKFTVAPASKDDTNEYDWGYLAAIGDHLIGSANRRHVGYKGDVGEWYEDFKPGQIDRVTSSHLFMKDRHTGKQHWLYRKGVVLNSTITIGGGKIYFVESRNPQALTRAGDRLVDELNKDQHLVALDIASGQQVWEKPVDLSKCEYMVYLSYAQQTLLATGTDRHKTFHMFAFDAGGGSKIWERSDKAKKNHHSGQLQHPVHIHDKIYVNQHIVSLREGKTLRDNIAERRGCGTMSASNGSLFYRHYFQGMWDLESDTRSEFMGIRSGCWLGIIPAGGVVLAPETSSGCSCTHAIQTSVAWVPIQRADRKVPAKANDDK